MYEQRPAGPAPISNFAIASFILGLIGGILLSVVFGIVALRRIKSRGQRGRGFAIAGLVLSGLWVIGIAALIVIGSLTGAERDGSGRITEGGSISTLDLREGDCLKNFDNEGIALSVDAVPCREPHTGEVLYDRPLSMSADAFPGQAPIDNEAERGCSAEVARLPERVGSPGAFFFRPTKETWEERNDRSVTCVARFQAPRRGAL